MGDFTLVVEFEIEPGKSDEFKTVAQMFIDRTQEEPGTLRYDWHISDDGRLGINLERFEDGNAFLAHDGHVADIAPNLAGVAEIVRFHVIGEASDDVRAKLAETATGYYAHFSGIDR